jgi:hypothetical protein
MTVIIDGAMDYERIESLEWDKLQAEESLNTSLEQLNALIESVGGTEWSDAFGESTGVTS